MTYIGEEFQKRFKTLPADIQNALTAVASVDMLTAIGKKHGLMVDQIGKMADEIWKVMLGLANPKDFIRNLASALDIESEKASAIANDVNAQMFQPIRESLRRIYDSSTPLPQQNSGKVGASQIPPAVLKEKAVSFPSSLRATEGSEAIPRPKDWIASSASPSRNDGIPPMIYPQDRFEEEFMKPEQENVSRIMKHEAREEKEKEQKPPEQFAPLVPAVVPPDNFTYPEKTEEVHREPAIGNYKGRDPYRESTEE